MASIRQRGINSYEITVSAGYENGRKVRKMKNIKVPDNLTDRQREAYIQHEADEFERRVKGGSSTQYDKMKFKDFANNLYMKSHGSTLKAKTRREYEIHLHDRLLPYFGEMYLKDITPLDIRHWLASLERIDGSGVPLSENSKGVFFRTLSAILGKAYEWELIDSNPCEKVKQPRKAQSDVKALQVDEVKTVLDKLPQYEDERVKALIILLLNTGIRESEAAGLEWQDINFDTSEIQIKRECIYIPNEGIIEDTPKSKSGTRKFYFPEFVSDALRTYKEYQAAEINARGDLWTGARGERTKLFTQFNGSPVHDSTLRKWVKKYMVWAGVPYVTVHGLRHTYASMMMSLGVDARTIAAQLGHSSPALVFNTYANPQEHAKKKAAEKLNELFKSAD